MELDELEFLPSHPSRYPSPPRRRSRQTMLAFKTNICYNPPFPPSRTPGPMPAFAPSAPLKKAEFHGVLAETAPPFRRPAPQVPCPRLHTSHAIKREPGSTASWPRPARRFPTPNPRSQARTLHILHSIKKGPSSKASSPRPAKSPAPLMPATAAPRILLTGLGR